MSKDISNHFLDSVLDEARRKVFLQLPSTVDGWYLAGGTALALQIGHRISYDFDFFSQKNVASSLRQHVISIFGNSIHFTMDSTEQLTFFTAEQIKFTFAKTPFAPIVPLVQIENVSVESPTDIAADKAFTIGRRGVLRDYVDLYFLLAKHTTLATIISNAQKKYGSMFDEKLFLEQLDYLDDIQDDSIELIGSAVPKDTIRDFLHEQIRLYLKKANAAVE